MGMIRTAVAISALSASVFAQAPLEQNRLQLDNEGDILWILNSVFVGSDPANGDYSGDLYYKVFPEAANTRCSGDFTWTGSEYGIFDDDWSTGAELYTISLGPATDPDGNDTLTPDYGAASEIVLLGGTITWDDLTGVPFALADCPPAGFLTGFVLRETYIDTAGGSATIDPLFSNIATGDLAISGFFPGGQSIAVPAVNFCGGSGDASLSWLGSTDNADPLNGENQPDWTALPGASAYGGFAGGVGGGGAPAFVEESLDGGAEFALLLDRPTMNIKVDVGLDASPLVEVGLAGLNPQIGIDGTGLPTGTSAQIGVQLYSESSKPTNNVDGLGAGGFPFVGVTFVNVGPTLLALTGSCTSVPGVLEDLAVNPGDPVLTVVTSPSGINLFTDGDTAAAAGTANSNVDWDGNGSPDDGVYNGNLIPISPSVGLVGIGLSWQTFTANAVTSAAVGSNVFRTTFRATI